MAVRRARLERFERGFDDRGLAALVAEGLDVVFGQASRLVVGRLLVVGRDHVLVRQAAADGVQRFALDVEAFVVAAGLELVVDLVELGLVEEVVVVFVLGCVVFGLGDVVDVVDLVEIGDLLAVIGQVGLVQNLGDILRIVVVFRRHGGSP
ncbi:hypothetical protein SGCZBJ_15690 [Caulobacter zeae]|uniref:Uncharacterized protein n=1 Tax=Caulobacter zeae TaxID=2055137 RepID=A0A2N5DBJ5_9CAUL|nr:hypothetical protein SGCZBJ_15690 [Caulobacter zeae]